MAETPAIEGYRILDLLGQGGMGSVYLAEQEQPIRRTVAIKVVKAGMDTATVLRRFERERDGLARLDHDHIVRLFDVGTTARGRPYFAMEHVDGASLLAFCDRQRMAVPDRLQVFATVCRAVHHAHQKGVIHRDLKPGNVLIDAATGAPKIIDFGLALVTHGDASKHETNSLAATIVGTPDYMAPEQIVDGGTGVDSRVDVYALGAMLYELLVGVVPFAEHRLTEVNVETVPALVGDGPRRPSTRLDAAGATMVDARQTTVEGLRRALRHDLDWVVQRAMQPDPDHRYPSAAALADDLDRYRHGDAVTAGPPTTAYRLRVLVRRHRGLLLATGAVFVTALVFALVTVVFNLRADAHARKAADHAAAAATSERNAAAAERRARDQATTAASRRAEFDLLANVVRLEEATAQAAALSPAWPDQIPAIKSWLVEFSEPLRAALPELRATVATMEARALPRRAADIEHDQRTHPRWTELLDARGEVERGRLALAVRGGAVDLTDLEFPAELASHSPAQLTRLARRVVEDYVGNRRGQERWALAVARRAAERAGQHERAEAIRILATAEIICGLYEPALSRLDRAIAGATDHQSRDRLARVRTRLGEIVANRKDALAGHLARAEAKLAELEDIVARRRTWRFTTEAERFLHRSLVDVTERIETFVAARAVAVERQRSWAEHIERLTLAHPNAPVSWAAARVAIRAADGVTASRAYADTPIELAPQMGLVPIGMNPVTGLWEFYHLRSAWDSRSDQDPAALPIPRHASDGSLPVSDDTGIVFVLLPGGTFRMGAQNRDPSAPNFDPMAQPADGPVHEVSLAPFFLGRFEVSRGQWQRLTDGEPSTSTAATHPVAALTWAESDHGLATHGLTLPTEAQWERGCRAGTDTPWHCGVRSTDLQGYANLMDRTAKRETTWTMAPVPFDDGHAGVAPVGSFRGNPWGLFDMHGNVDEWCRDRWAPHDRAVAPGNGQRIPLASDPAAYHWRGGGYASAASRARSADCSARAPRDGRAESIGMRAARAILR